LQNDYHYSLELLYNLFNISPRLLHDTTPYFAWSIGYWGLKYYFNLMDEVVRSGKMLLMAKNAQLKNASIST